MPELKRIEFGENQYCGPSVMSAVTGLTTDQAARVIQSVTRQSGKVKGVFPKDLIEAFSRVGFECKQEFVNQTLFYTLMQLKEDGMYVLVVPGHYIAIEVNGAHKYICDNNTKEPMNATASARLGQKITEIIKVTKKPIVEYVPPSVTRYHYRMEFDLDVVNGKSMIDMAEILKGAIIMKTGFNVSITWETKINDE